MKNLLGTAVLLPITTALVIFVIGIGNYYMGGSIFEIEEIEIYLHYHCNNDFGSKSNSQLPQLEFQNMCIYVQEELMFECDPY